MRRKTGHRYSLSLHLILLINLLTLAQSWGSSKQAKEADSDSDHKVDIVTYGSVIKLEHIPTGYRLHSHKISYGGGSGQQSVTCHSSTGDSNSFWTVKGEFEKPRVKQGVRVKCGDIVRFQHLNTGKNLHSHLHKSPLTRDKEVSAYAVGERDVWNDGDSGDNWEIICEDDGDFWKRFQSVSLRHVDAMNYLDSSRNNVFSNPISGQLQVAGASKNTKNSKWRTNEGIYFAPIDT